ncbi:Uma2 family endonuclease [Nocardia cyriacigeorgica]|uniref:Uma2 family endonuclease n=1 Tax=Nocardia cyriacigeorgica TaxID=135487 RepID=UPI001895A786|nr:Uma2 family endonuclease [Nocardia cyriacigeorgica]MBF6086121.1 Uma2 family endonuclease [Nocardia cyriacigeorgica]MBF6092211.1 Uma2 family endonuclease [Nocardia cyriacigeorgica]MBF6396805.1 Uma2 family endonuclease [Nocardia cyriacigeorgica]MBF6403537.1 Uma2 family endonuclease [Nocardia cyriacigeorgica]
MTTPEPFPQWLRPRPRGFVGEDLDLLPSLPPHTELIDGSLVFAARQTEFHMLAVTLVETGLRRCAPDCVRIRRAMTVTLGRNQRPEPDVLAIVEEADRGRDLTTYQAADVILVVEVVSAESRTRDRERKPQLYAKAGIPHFWRVENIDGRPVIYVYELAPTTGTYAPSGIFHDRLKVSVPFEIDIDLSEIDRL